MMLLCKYLVNLLPTHEEIYTAEFIATLFLITKAENNPKCPFESIIVYSDNRMLLSNVD